MKHVKLIEIFHRCLFVIKYRQLPDFAREEQYFQVAVNFYKRYARDKDKALEMADNFFGQLEGTIGKVSLDSKVKPDWTAFVNAANKKAGVLKFLISKEDLITFDELFTAEQEEEQEEQ